MSRTAALLAGLLFAMPLSAEDLGVTVVTILASEKESKIDQRLQLIGREIQKERPALKGFRIERTDSRKLPLGELGEFDTIDGQKAKIRIERREDKDSKVRLRLTAPTIGDITYNIVPGKFFPVVTRHYYGGVDKELLIIAVKVSAEPAPAPDRK